jgi:predicted glycosyltransferase
MPIVKYLQVKGHVPVFCGNASQLSFITETISGIETVELPGYNISYSSVNRFAQAGLLAQIPGVLKTIKAENQWLQQQVKKNDIDGIISDNRYGLHHPAVPSVIMTHQLRVQSGMGELADAAVQRLHYRLLDRFNETWVIDTREEPSLGGKLSHAAKLPKKARHIGLLSRFADRARCAETEQGNIVILLSGPEPARTGLSAILWQQMQNYAGKVTFIEGSEHAIQPVHIPAHISYHKRLTQDVLTPVLQRADMVVCRSGYSTLMDLAALGKRAIVIPTPGQTEQGYLGRSLHERGLYYCAQQKGFNLEQALKKAREIPEPFYKIPDAFNSYQKVLDEWLSRL